MEYKYLSEDELKQLIALTERTGMLQAPGRVEKAVWSRIEQQERAAKLSLSTEKSGRRKQAQLAVYSLKVGLGAVAAIFMLLRLGSLHEKEWILHMPDVQESMEEENPWEMEKEDFLHEKWTEVSEWFGTILESQEAEN